MTGRRLGRCRLLPFMVPGTAHAARLGIELTRNGRSMVRVAVRTPGTFATGHCPLGRAAPAKPGSAVVNVHSPPGRCAVQACHGEDSDGRLRRGLSGIPAEVTGSRDARRLRHAGP